MWGALNSLAASVDGATSSLQGGLMSSAAGFLEQLDNANTRRDDDDEENDEDEEDEEDVPTILWLFPYLLHAGDPKRRSTWAFACASTFRISASKFVMTCSLRRRDADKLRDLRCNSASFVLDA